MQFKHPLPFSPWDCLALESVQKLAVKFVKGLRHVPYETTLQRLQLFSLIRRRIRGDLICMYKIMHGLLDFPCDAVFAAPTRIGLRGHTLKIPQQRCKTRRRQHAFSVRVIPYCNKLLLHPWRHSNLDWTHNGSPSSQKFPSNPSPNTPSHICSTLSHLTLCY